MNLAEVLKISKPERYRVAKHFVADFRFDGSNLHFLGQQSKPFKIWDSGDVTNLLPILVTGGNGLFVGNFKIKERTFVATAAPGNPCAASEQRVTKVCHSDTPPTRPLPRTAARALRGM